MNTAYEIHNNEIGVRLSFLLNDEDRKHPRSIGAISYQVYEKRVQRDKSIRLKVGKGAGNEVLLRWEALEPEWRDELLKVEGNPLKDHNPMEEHFVLDQRARIHFEGFTFEDGLHLKPEQIEQYTMNASVLNALEARRMSLISIRKRSGNAVKDVWPTCVSDLKEFDGVLMRKYKLSYDLPTNERRLKDSLNAYLKESYPYLIDKRSRNQNAAKVKTDEQSALLSELLRKHNNYNNAQITELYNMAAMKLGWKLIEDSTVALHRAKRGLYIFGGSRGETAFRNKKTMQVKRKAPSVAMIYWTLDGWDAELLYQKQIIDEKGHKVTTYHNRLTVVVVLDPVNKYPVGYAIGDHETPDLITEALRDAANHTAQLFGSRFRPLQLQSDNYAIKTLSPVYEAMTKHFTPGRVHNSKTKVIEPYFDRLNDMCQLHFYNWSGHNVDAEKENQPNQDYLNKIRHQFPDEAGCRKQIEFLINKEREEKREEYLKKWEALPEQDRLPLSTADYLYLFGITHTHTNRLRGEGLVPTLLGQALTFDTFDMRFREHAYMDWAIKYDPTDLSSILVLNAKADKATSKVKQIVGTHRFELTQKYVQPMALYDRKEGDAAELAKIGQFNKQLEQTVIDRASQERQHVERLFIQQPQLNDTLVKMVLTDSRGQHKDQRNEQRKITNRKTINIPAPKPEKEDYEILDDDFRSEYGVTD